LNARVCVYALADDLASVTDPERLPHHDSWYSTRRQLVQVGALVRAVCPFFPHTSNSIATTDDRAGVIYGVTTRRNGEHVQ
jgi:hypothetical protein